MQLYRYIIGHHFLKSAVGASGGDDDVYVRVYTNNILPVNSAKESLIDYSIKFYPLMFMYLKYMHSVHPSG